MDDMGGGMGLVGFKMSGWVDQGCYLIVNGEIIVEMYFVDDQVWYWMLYVKNFKVDFVGVNDVRIRILVIYFGIEWGFG